MAEENWLPLAELARRSDIPETSARRYARLFPDALPHRREGRALLYAPQTGAILVRIGQLFAEGRTAGQVREALRTEFQCIEVNAMRDRADNPAPADRRPSLQGEDIRSRLAEFLRHVVDQKRAITSLRDDFGQVRRELVEERARRQALESENRKIKKALLVLMRQRKAAIESGPAQGGDQDLRAKLGVLEQELVRLRKDRRELERYLLEKIGKGE